MPGRTTRGEIPGWVLSTTDRVSSRACALRRDSRVGRPAGCSDGLAAVAGGLNLSFSRSALPCGAFWAVSPLFAEKFDSQDAADYHWPNTSGVGEPLPTYAQRDCPSNVPGARGRGRVRSSRRAVPGPADQIPAAPDACLPVDRDLRRGRGHAPGSAAIPPDRIPAVFPTCSPSSVQQ